MTHRAAPTSSGARSDQHGQPRSRRSSRDRRGRGLRGGLLPADVPLSRTRTERFDALILEAFEPIESRLGDRLRALDVAVDDAPELGRDADADSVWGADVVADGAVPLARLVGVGVDRAGMPTRARVVVYRKPMEARAPTPQALVALLHDVLMEQVSRYLGQDPDGFDEPE